MKGAIATLLTSAILARADVITTSEPAQPQITAEINTTKTESPVSDVKGLAFNRFYQVWLENVVSVVSRAFLLAWFVDMLPGLQHLGSRLQLAVAGLAGYLAVR